MIDYVYTYQFLCDDKMMKYKNLDNRVKIRITYGSILLLGILIGYGISQVWLEPIKLAKYGNGFKDAYVQQITEFSNYCKPANVEVFPAVDMNGRQWGLVYKCPEDNSTMILKQSNVE